MNHVIAEYELNNVDSRRFTLREIWEMQPLKEHLKSVWKAVSLSRFCISVVLFGVAISIYGYNVWNEQKEVMAAVLDYCLRENVVDITPIVCSRLQVDEMASAVWGEAFEFCAILIFYICYCVILSYLITKWRPYCIALSMGMGQTTRMRLTRRGCLLVGRESGVRMYLPWVDYKEIRVGSRYLLFIHDKDLNLRLPLPGLSPQEVSRLRNELHAAFESASSTAAPTTPPAHALVWTGNKIVSPTAPKSFIVRDRHNVIAAACVGAVAALLMAGLWCMGAPIKLLGIVLLGVWLNCCSLCAIVRVRTEWRYVFRRDRYVLYSPLGGVCSVPWRLVRDVVHFGKKISYFRLKDDDFSLFPCVGWEQAEPLRHAPQVDISSSSALYSWGLILLIALGFYCITTIF